MMGSGKSTIAPLLSDKLKIPYIDIDQDLEEILNCNIVDIFKQYSEERFRILESRYFLEHIKNSSTIYSTGGGIVLDKQNRNALKKTAGSSKPSLINSSYNLIASGILPCE